MVASDRDGHLIGYVGFGWMADARSNQRARMLATYHANARRRAGVVDANGGSFLTRVVVAVLLVGLAVGLLSLTQTRPAEPVSSAPEHETHESKPAIQLTAPALKTPRLQSEAAEPEPEVTGQKRPRQKRPGQNRRARTESFRQPPILCHYPQANGCNQRSHWTRSGWRLPRNHPRQDRGRPQNRLLPMLAGSVKYPRCQKNCPGHSFGLMAASLM